MAQWLQNLDDLLEKVGAGLQRRGQHGAALEWLQTSIWGELRNGSSGPTRQCWGLQHRGQYGTKARVAADAPSVWTLRS